jgi:membrane-associated phospholipid phosphatase
VSALASTTDGRPGAGNARDRARLWALVRPEEYLLFAVGGIFAALHFAGVYTAAFRTSFVRAGWDLFAVFAVIATAIAGWRAARRARGRPDDLPRWAVAVLVAAPLVAVGVLAMGGSAWKRSYLAWAWAAAGAWLVVAAVLAVAGDRRAAAGGDAGGGHGAGRVALAFAGRTVLEVLEFARAWLPFVVLVAAYENALILIARINPDLHDPGVFELDELLFGGHLDVWFQHLVTVPETFRLLGRTFRLGTTEAFAFFYDSLYLYPVLIGMILYFRRRTFEFRSFMLAFVLAGYVGYAGYVAVPVVGPMFYYPGLYQVDLYTGAGREKLEAAPATDASDDSTVSFYLLSQKLSARGSWGGSTPRNCYPSLHTAWGVILLIFAWRHLRPLFWVIVGPLAMLIGATSYLRYHYLTDVVAGALLAVAMAALTPRLEAAWRRWAGGPSGAAPAAPPSGLLKRWPRVQFGMSVGAFLAFTAFVMAYVYASDSVAGRDAVARSLGTRLVGREAPVLTGVERVGAVFADAVELTGVRTDKPSYRQGELVELTLWWRCVKPVAGDWKVFLHVRPDTGPITLNLDHHPAIGAYPTRLWAEGDVVRDVVVFRAPTPGPRGEFRVVAGLFSESAVGRRAPVTTPGSRPVNDDGVELPPLRVRW